MTRLADAEQALRDDPTVGGCIDFLRYLGVPDVMVGDDKGQLGAALNKYRPLLSEHLADALMDFMRVFNERKKVLPVPKAVREYLGARTAGVTDEDTQPKKLTEHQEALVDGLVGWGWQRTKAKTYIKDATGTDEEIMMVAAKRGAKA